MQLIKPTVALFLVFNLVSSMVIREKNVTRFASYDDIEEIPPSAPGRSVLRKPVIPAQEPASNGRVSYEEIPSSVMESEMMSNGSELVKMESQKGVNLIYDTTHFMIHFMIKL